MTRLLTIALVLLGFWSSACGGKATTGALPLSADERHQLYSAALASSDSPLETDIFKDVCRRIDIFDAEGRPNSNYLTFISAHVDWAMKDESRQFKTEINSREKAREYISKHLPR